MMRWIILGLLLLGSVESARAEMWRYEDASGAISFTDSLDGVPQEFRHTARRHTVQESKVKAVPTIDEIKAERLRIISTFTANQASAALNKGILTEEEVKYLVEKGALRLTGVGDSLRFGKSASQVQAERAAQIAANAASAEDRDTQMLRELAGMNTGRVAQIELAKQAAEQTLDPEKVKFSLIGTGALAVVMFLAMPFLMRKYNDDGTRRIIRTSFFFSFLIISSTGNFMFFRDEIFQLLNLKRGLTKAPATASTPQPVNQGKRP